MEIFKKLESLGLFDWLREKGFGSGFTPMILDAQPFDSIERSGYNAIAFRWFREKYNLHPYIITLRGEWIVIGIIRCSDAEKITGSFNTNFNTLEEAELECLKKLIEIVKEK